MGEVTFFRKENLTTKFLSLYFLAAFVEIVAEYFKDVFFISVSKPLLMPMLMLTYWSASRKINHTFIIALLFVWGANLAFISNTMNSIIVGTLFFLGYRILIIYLVFKMLKFPGYVPMLIGAVPFLFLYIFIATITYDILGNTFILFIIQGVFTIFFGGFCLGNYFIKPNTSNTLLLISTMLFTATQFILIIKIYYSNFSIFQPIAMLLFVVGQFLLYKFLLHEEKKLKRYLIINKHVNAELEQS